MPALLAAAHGDISVWDRAVSAAHATDDSRRDALVSHDTANTLPACNVRRFGHEHPPCLELTRLPWANRPPKRQAPSQSTTAAARDGNEDRTSKWEPPKLQVDADSVTPAVIDAVSWLHEWDDIGMATSDARTDFQHAGKVEHPRRRTERAIPVETLKPLIDKVVLDTRQAQTRDGNIDWSKVVVLDTTAVTPNTMNHRGIARV